MSRKDSSGSKASNTPEKIKKYFLRKSSGRTLSSTATKKTGDKPCTSRSACTAETPATDTLRTMAEDAILIAISALDKKLTKRLDEIEDKRVDKLKKVSRSLNPKWTKLKNVLTPKRKK